MARLHVPVTKSNLIRIKEELRFAREGKDLLTLKREVLVMELMRLQDDAIQAREELDQLLAEAYNAFSMAAMMEGFDGMERLALAIAEGPPPKIEERSVMGVIVPIVKAKRRDWQPTYGLAHGSAASDHTIQRFMAVEHKLFEVAEIETAIYRLAAETRKTLRRERALENIFIPQYRETVRFLEQSLEEKERESFYQLKLIKGGMPR